MTIENMDVSNTKAVENYLQTATKEYVDTSDIYMGFEDKTFIDGSGWIPDPGYDCTQRSWYLDAIKADQTIVGEPYFDLVTDSMVDTSSSAGKSEWQDSRCCFNGSKLEFYCSRCNQ